MFTQIWLNDICWSGETVLEKHAELNQSWICTPPGNSVVTKKTLAGVEWEMNFLNLRITLYLVYSWRLIPSIKKQSSEMRHLARNSFISAYGANPQRKKSVHISEESPKKLCLRIRVEYLNCYNGRMSWKPKSDAADWDVFVRNLWESLTWRIIPGLGYVVIGSPPFISHLLEGEQPDLPTMVFNHLQVLGWSSK